jgi:hypothetical protein
MKIRQFAWGRRSFGLRWVLQFISLFFWGRGDSGQIKVPIFVWPVSEYSF